VKVLIIEDTPKLGAAIREAMRRAQYVSDLAPTIEEADALLATSPYDLILLDLSLPDGDGTMLDSSIVVMCSEVCDGNTHLHDDMPFVLAGGASGRISTGRLIDTGYRRHADLWVSVANAMGQPTEWFGDASGGGIPGLLSA